jgi:hypothetical protein
MATTPTDGAQDHAPQSPESLRPPSARHAAADEPDPEDVEGGEGGKGRPTKWSMGVLNDPKTHEVPGMPAYLHVEVIQRSYMLMQ